MEQMKKVHIIDIIATASFVILVCTMFIFKKNWIFFVGLLPVISVFVYAYKRRNRVLLTLINSSLNPRKEFWILFLNNRLNDFHIERIPSLKFTIKEFADKYDFYYKDQPDKICFALNKTYFRYRDSGNNDRTHLISQIKDIKIVPHIINEEDYRWVLLKMEVRLFSGKYDFCNITKVDFPIDEIEQILIHFGLIKN
jgi:hypothetical protein